MFTKIPQVWTLLWRPPNMILKLSLPWHQILKDAFLVNFYMWFSEASFQKKKILKTFHVTVVYIDPGSTGGLNIKIQQSQGGSSGNYSAVVQEWGLTVIRLNTGTEFRQHGGSWDLSLTTSSLNVASLCCLFSKRWWVGGSRFNSLIGGSCTDARIQGRSMCYNSK